MGGPLSVTFSDIHMVKMGNDGVTSKTIFYHWFEDYIYSRQILGDNVLFDELNNYHPNIKLTTEVSSSMFLYTKLTNIIGDYKFNI